MYVSKRESLATPFEVPQPTTQLSSAMPESLEATQAETRLTLRVLSTGRVLRLHAHDELLIGRKDEARGILPDIDLGADGGYDSGVSRRHAIISWHNGSYFVEDLVSANGTFVNEERVEPQVRTPIHNGDAIRCGMLDLRVEISP